MEEHCDEFIPKSRGPYAEKYTPDSLREAMENIRNNEMSYGAASKIYNVPKAILHHKMRNPENLPKGATTVLTKEQEDELEQWILLHADFGDPRTKRDIIIAAAEIAQLDTNPSHGFKNGIPTSGWMEGFLNRHPLCRERTPQGISKASAINTKDDFAGLWRNIYDYFEKTKQLDLLNKPELWWNADETCFEKDMVPKKTVGANYGINQTESGWTKTESFYYFVSMHLHNQWEEKNCPKPRILTIDGYGAHLSPKLFRWCRRNAVIMIVLYPGATPYMQMCDTTMFSPMKKKHEQLHIEPPAESICDTTLNQPKVNVLSNAVLDSSSEHYINQGELSTLMSAEENTSMDSPDNNTNYCERPMEIEPVQYNHASVSSQRTNIAPVFELVDISMDEIPDGPLISAEYQNLLSQEHAVQSLENDRGISTATAMNAPTSTDNCVAFYELAGPNEFLKSQSGTKFDLTAFGIPTGTPNTENASKMEHLADKIRHDVKQLGLLCAASNKEKLINILIINQQLDAIDPPPIERAEPPEESHTIKSILRPPTMPQRVNRKRNLNLKVSYGVVTAKEVVQSIMEREAANQQHEMEREEDEIAKLARENEIAAVDDEFKFMRKLVSDQRSEVMALNKELVQKKKKKAISISCRRKRSMKWKFY
ncbi:hypothetical protein Bhyg_12358, partial [Pseudolycoriella hygida]